MNQSSPIVAILFLLPIVANADTGDDTLAYYLAKSDLVVVGRIGELPVAVFTEEGVPNYICDFEVSEVLKGNKSLDDTTIRINVMRFERNEKDRHPLLKDGAECIVFLKVQPQGTIPRYATADFWYGIQHFSPWMAKSLKRVAENGRPAPE